MAAAKKASKTRKAVAVAMVCGGAVVATPRPAAALPVPNISIEPPGPVKKIEIGALKAGASEVLVTRLTFPNSQLAVEVNPRPRKARGNKKYVNIVLKRGGNTNGANPR